MINKPKLKKGDRVVVITGKDKGSEGKILVVDRKKGRVIVEGANMISKTQKARGEQQGGGFIKKEAPINISNVMYVHKGKPTRIGFTAEIKEVDGKKVTIKRRVAKSTGEVID